MLVIGVVDGGRACSSGGARGGAAAHATAATAAAAGQGAGLSTYISAASFDG